MDNVYKNYVPPVSGGIYNKFEDGVTYTFRIASQPVVYETDFTNKITNETTTSSKYAWLVFDLVNKAFKVLSLPVTGYRQIAALGSDEDFGDPEGYNLKITRRGTGLDTVYTIIPGANRDPLSTIAGDAFAELAKLDLIELISAGNGVHNVFWLSDAIGKTSRKAMTKAQVNAADYPEDDGLKTEAKHPIDLSEIPF